MSKRKWKAVFVGDKDNNAWALHDQEGKEREPSHWYDSEAEAMTAKDRIITTITLEVDQGWLKFISDAWELVEGDEVFSFISISHKTMS